MKLIATLLMVTVLAGCAVIPSFWDDNQSSRIVDIQQQVVRIDCAGDQLAQAQAILSDIQWFELYSTSKGSRQSDVLRLLEPMKQTVTDWQKRSQDGGGSVVYCRIKKQLLEQQAATASRAVLGRF
jgi:lipid A disaccharide synthetase